MSDTVTESALSIKSIDRLLRLEQNVADQALRLNVRFNVSPDSIRDRLTTLSPDTISHIFRSFEHLDQVFGICMDTGLDVWNDKEFFKLSMRALKLSFPSDVMDKMGSEDIIEAYDMQRRQVFRNMRFMESSSYSLTEIFAYEWPELFERSMLITRQLIEASERVVWDENRTIPSLVPKHLIRELRSQSPQACEVEHKYFAPLFSGPGRPGGILSICSGRPVEVDILKKSENVTFI